MLSIHKHTHKEKNMFTTDFYIDSVQSAKKTFVNTFVTDDKFKEELVKLVDAQTKFTKGQINSTLDIVQSIVKNTSDTFYSLVKKGA